MTYDDAIKALSNDALKLVKNHQTIGLGSGRSATAFVKSLSLFVKKKKEFLFDAEHFFDGYKNNPEYALSCIKTAFDEGARWIVLCDTNGGTLPNEVGDIVSKVSQKKIGRAVQ